MELKDWLTLGIGLIGLFAGSGWLKYYFEVKNSKRSKSEVVLKTFLLRLQSILYQNKRTKDVLLKDSEFKNLEYDPVRLHRFFSGLPDGDSRKLAWKIIIEDLIKRNEEAKQLINDFAGEIVRPSFRAACDKYLDHANNWSAVWRAAIGDYPVAGEFNQSGQLLSPEFPKEMDTELEKEIGIKKQQAGLLSE